MLIPTVPIMTVGLSVFDLPRFVFLVFSRSEYAVVLAGSVLNPAGCVSVLPYLSTIQYSAAADDCLHYFVARTPLQAALPCISQLPRGKRRRCDTCWHKGHARMCVTDGDTALPIQARNFQEFRPSWQKAFATQYRIQGSARA